MNSNLPISEMKNAIREYSEVTNSFARILLRNSSKYRQPGLRHGYKKSTRRRGRI